MVYVVIDDEKGSKIMLVKVQNEEELAKRLRIPDTSKVLGALTDNEIMVLESSSFAVISA